MIVNISDHGGECCGVTHLYNFTQHVETNHMLLEKQLELLDDEDFKLDELNLNEAGNHLYEIVLTDIQIKVYPHFVKVLKKKGFKLVTRFFNANSGNYCNVLHYQEEYNDKLIKESPWNTK